MRQYANSLICMPSVCAIKYPYACGNQFLYAYLWRSTWFIRPSSRTEISADYRVRLKSCRCFPPGSYRLVAVYAGYRKIYGLKNNSLIDERRDPVKSTWAAARYLKDLYDIYQDWNLVLAAYNCGPGTINKAIRRAGGATDYWTIYNYLPKEPVGTFLLS